jgi:hypothetical protein
MISANRAQFPLALLTALLLPVPAIGSGQSLGEVARQYRKEREARAKKGEAPARVFTNDDLAGMRPIAILESPGRAETKPPAPSQPPGIPGGEAPAGPAAHPGKAKAEDSARSKEYWQAKFKAARAVLAHAKEERTLVEDELHLLQIQQARELNPHRSRKLNGQIDAATVELEAKRAATEKARQAMETLEKEFRKSGAPREWIQEDKNSN